MSRNASIIVLTIMGATALAGLAAALMMRATGMALIRTVDLLIWIGVATTGSVIVLAILHSRGRSHEKNRTDRILDAVRAGAFIAIGIAALATGAVRSHNQPVEFIFVLTWVGLVFAGLILLGAAFFRPVPGGLCCSSCGYEFGFDSPGAAPDVCAECGADWTGSLVLRREPPRRSWIWIGFACFALALVLFLRPLGLNPQRFTPTNLLMREASRPNAADGTWEELDRRTLTSVQERQLAESLLRARSRDQGLTRWADGWFQRMIGAGSLPISIVDRYYRDMLDAWIIGPETARPGERVQVAVGANYLGDPTRMNQLFVVFGGFTGPWNVPVERSVRLIPAGRFGMRTNPMDPDASPEPREFAPEAAFTQSESSLDCTCELWLIVAPSGIAPVAEMFTPEGRPQIPGAVWMGELELRRTIPVAP